MKEINSIQMPTTVKYLSEFMSELPIGIFNKRSTSTGATTLCLENNEDVILVSPSVGLIDNKCRQYPNKRCDYKLLGVIQGITSKDIINYIEECKGIQPVKILITPESLVKILDIEEVYKYHFICDEFHMLLDMVSYRAKGTADILYKFNKFSKYTFLSASPIIEDFLPRQLVDLNYFVLESDNFRKVIPIPIQTSKPIATITDLINNFQTKGSIDVNGIESKHLYIYVNSVQVIANIIKSCNLYSTEVNIICGVNERNRAILGKVECKIGRFITEDELSKPKSEATFHFITKTGFQGQDVYSNDGIAIFVTDKHIQSTLSGMDSLQQVAGRIRTEHNPLRDTILHIFNTGNPILSEEEFKEKQKHYIKEADAYIEGWFTANEVYRESAIRDIENKRNTGVPCYYEFNEDRMHLNDMIIKAEQFKYKLESEIYKNGIFVLNAYEKAGFDYSEESTEVKVLNSITKQIKHRQFKDFCEDYNLYLNNDSAIIDPFVSITNNTKDLIILAFEKLGYNRIKELKFHQGQIKENLQKSLVKNSINIEVEVIKTFKIGARYAKKDIKEILQNLYDKIGYEIKAKATDINKWYDVKRVIKDGKEGLEIIRSIK